MESDDDVIFLENSEDEDSCNVSTDEDDDGLGIILSDNQPTSSNGEICGSSKGDMDIDDYPYEIMSTEQIVQYMIDSIKDVNTVVQLPPTITRILLNHFNWDKEKLYEAYFDEDREKLFKTAHIVSPVPENNVNSQSSQSQNGLYECDICCLDLPASMLTGLACEHRFCKDCWINYLTTKIMEEGMGNKISCAASDCHILVDDQTVMTLVTDTKVKLKYQHLITNSFVECNRLLRWCPKPECTTVIKVNYLDCQPVKCSQCQTVFCFQCADQWHEPVKCDLLKKWKKKCDDDSETANWIAANTKECPKCFVTIEKDGGCNHMICKNQNCKHNFCWVCLGPWEAHGSSYNCNRYDENAAKNARDAQERSRAALQRYLHYCNRYMNHMQSLKFENKLYASIKEKMDEMQSHNMSWIEVQFLRKAVDVLCECRQTLMFTYCFAYYLQKTNQSIIFEENQKDLENSTEKLSEYLERDITGDNINTIKQKVQDKYRYCESRRKVLLQHVHEGYDKDWWKYTVTVDK